MKNGLDWIEKLGGDVDQEFLIKGISQGFHIIDDIDCANIEDVSCNNHLSVEKYHDIVEKELLHQIQEGDYQIVLKKTPKIVSPLGAIPKGDKGVCIIHDCSRPKGNAVNNKSIQRIYDTFEAPSLLPFYLFLFLFFFLHIFTSFS